MARKTQHQQSRSESLQDYSSRGLKISHGAENQPWHQTLACCMAQSTIKDVVWQYQAARSGTRYRWVSWNRYTYLLGA